MSCETKTYPTEVKRSQGDLNTGYFNSQNKFTGISSISNVTDTTATLNWTESDAAAEYHIYKLESDTPVLIDKVVTPATSITFTQLESGKSYIYMVRMKDLTGLMDENIQELTATTLSVPVAPTFLYRSNPLTKNDTIKTPSITISGVNIGDTVELHVDSACSSKVASGIATEDSVTLTTTALSVGSYNFYSKRINMFNVSSSCSDLSVATTAAYNLLTCPDGYVLVPGDALKLVSDFCVMQFEAKAWLDLDQDNIVDAAEVDVDGCNESDCSTQNWGTTTYIPGSVEDGKPWRMLDIEMAKLECQSLGENYDLISNIEWMAIAHNAENVSSNWSTDEVGDGCLFRGNNGQADACGYDFAGIDFGDTIIRDTKGSLELSNANVIWDFAGNISEWVDWSNMVQVSTLPYSCSETWTQFSSSFCNEYLVAKDYLPADPASVGSTYNSTYGLGKIEGGVGGVLTRGGSYEYGDKAGAFSASFIHSLKSMRYDVGFRCVYRIPQD